MHLLKWFSDEAWSRQQRPAAGQSQLPQLAGGRTSTQHDALTSMIVSWPQIPASKCKKKLSKSSPGVPNLKISDYEKWNKSSAHGQCRRRQLPVPQRHCGQDFQALLLRQGLPPRREIIEYRFHIGTSPLYFRGLPLRSSTSLQSAIVGYSCCLLSVVLFIYYLLQIHPINILETHCESAFN